MLCLSGIIVTKDVLHMLGEMRNSLAEVHLSFGFLSVKNSVTVTEKTCFDSNDFQNVKFTM